MDRTITSNPGRKGSSFSTADAHFIGFDDPFVGTRISALGRLQRASTCARQAPAQDQESALRRTTAD